MECKSVLVIESDHDARVTIRRCLEDAGHFVTSATTGAEAVSIVERMMPDLILLNPDVQIPGLTDLGALLRNISGLEKVPLAQIGVDKKLLEGVFCAVDPSDFKPILKWLSELRK